MDSKSKNMTYTIIFLVFVLSLTIFMFMRQASIISSSEILYFKNGVTGSDTNSRYFYLDYSINQNETIINSLYLKFTPVESVILTYGPELTNTYYGRLSSNKGKCIASNTYLTQTNCCKFMGYDGVTAPPGDGYDYCFKYVNVYPNLTKVTVAGTIYSLNKETNYWVTNDLSVVVNNHCSGDVYNNLDECNVPIIITNEKLDNSGVAVSIENLTFKGEEPVIIINETPVINNTNGTVIIPPPVKISFWQRLWEWILYLLSFRWI